MLHFATVIGHIFQAQKSILWTVYYIVCNVPLKVSFFHVSLSEFPVLMHNIPKGIVDEKNSSVSNVMSIEHAVGAMY
jgi:hypothetical protein